VSGTGAVIHTINPRLFHEQIQYIVDHAQDGVLFFDLTFLPLVEKLAPACPSVRTWVAMTDPAHMPPSSLPNLQCYEALLDGETDDFEWPLFDEDTAAALCYTSGTTGHPKGVLFSHRSTVLHALAVCLPDAKDYSSRSVVLPIVPMFHVNAWGIPYSAPLVGAKLVFPGPGLDGKSLYELLESERGRQLGRRADDLAGPHQLHEAERPAAPSPQEHHDRRRGVSRVDDHDAAGRFRRDGAPRLGHDGNEPGRHDRQHQAKHLDWPKDQRLALAAQAGTAALRRRDEDRRRREAAICRTTASRRGTSWCAVPGSCGTTTAADRRRRWSTAGFPPATWARSTRTAICRSPTGPRT
jgi:hypothetical protein